jgi:N-acetylmuramoyl-L-alanine amidase
MKPFIAVVLLVSTIQAQVTGLSDWNLFVDPGHSQTANMGVSGYSEAESNLTMALHLKNIFETRSDIAHLWTSRSNHTEVVGLQARSDMANLLNAAWFHSIHSNAPASTPAGNNVLILYGESTPGVEKTWAPGGQAVSNIMADVMSATMRIPEFGANGAWGDCVFYGVSSGPYLSVNRRTDMPSELSESGFHTIPSHNQLQMNHEYARMVAYSMFWTFLDHHDIERPTIGLLGGIIKSSQNGVPVNGAMVSVDGQSYTTDTFESRFHLYTSNPNAYHNGFYFFEDIGQGTQSVVVLAPGYFSDTLEVTMVEDFVTFLDVQLTPSTAPYVVESSPVDSSTSFSGFHNPSIRFSVSMDASSVEAAFAITPNTPGTLIFEDNSRLLTYELNDHLEFLTDYTMSIAGTAMDMSGNLLDGNIDGHGGDDWSISFTTGPEDPNPPQIVTTYPSTGATAVDLRPIFNIVWDEQLNPASILDSRVKLERLHNLQLQPTVLEHHIINNQSVLVLYSMTDLLDSEGYRIRIFPGFEDLVGNVQNAGTLLTFTTGNFNYSINSIDNFEGGMDSIWWQPEEAGNTTGTLPLETNLSENGDVTLENMGSSTSMALSYGWDLTADHWLIREYLAAGPPRTVHFNSSSHLQVFIFGDGNANSFRFCVDDETGTEVSPWYIVDWYGWNLVTWDMSTEGTGEWVGDGVLDGTLEFDSFQLSHIPGQPHIGTYYFDDLRIVTRNYLDLDEIDDSRPMDYALLPNYPNPFNPVTNIPFTLPEPADVSIHVYDLKGRELDHLLSGPFAAGRHITRWDASQVSSGIYLVKMDANDISITRKITVLK